MFSRGRGKKILDRSSPIGLPNLDLVAFVAADEVEVLG
jgi:hypothetical protein